MVSVKELDVQYVTNQAGEKTAVILTLANFHGLLEDLEDLSLAAERRDEPTISHADLLAELKQDGLLQH
ncbi:MAG: hypothetical protein HOP19_17550 [Acidobacteria bacterium]|nr:hypothetical protein [Acidobacteriota bacterium]